MARFWATFLAERSATGTSRWTSSASSATAPPCTLLSLPASASWARSRRMVDSEMPMRSARSPTVAEPSSLTMPKIFEWRLSASMALLPFQFLPTSRKYTPRRSRLGPNNPVRYFIAIGTWRPRTGCRGKLKRAGISRQSQSSAGIPPRTGLGDLRKCEEEVFFLSGDDLGSAACTLPPPANWRPRASVGKVSGTRPESQLQVLQSTLSAQIRGRRT